MWIIPILVIGAIAIAAASRSPRAAPSSRQLAVPPPRQLAASSSSCVPGPISVLGEILKVGQHPPPMVIMCAIAEAEAIGRGDLASDIVQAFVAPVVRQHQLARGRSHGYARGSCALPSSPRHAADAAVAPPTVIPPPSIPTAPPVSVPSVVPPPVPSSPDDVAALLDADPARFMEMARSGRLPAQTPPASPSAPPVPSPPPSAPQPPLVSQPTELRSETVARMQEDAGLPEAADRTRALAPGSPLGGVSDDAWRQFVMRLEREAPTFTSSRHVGQYRQRRERLADLGIDPGAIHGSAAAQRTALDADLTDAHHHAAAGGVLAEHLGRPIVIPGREAAETITLSGLLGVIQAAGLDGAVGWLERSNDRKRYPNTTQAFLRTNKVF